MGTPIFAATCLLRLIASRHHLLAVVTRADRPAGRGQKVSPSPVKVLAAEHGIETLQPRSAKDPAFAARLRELEPDLAVVVAYGRLLPNEIIEIPRLGCINAHASLLPSLRGAAPIERAILNGYDETGVTIMRISERMDAGDMMSSRRVAIDATTDGASLRDRLARVSAELLVEAVDAIADGSARFEPQDEKKATYAPPLDKAEAEIDWHGSAVDVDRVIRAFRPRPGAFTFHDGLRLKVLEGKPVAVAQATRRPGTILSNKEPIVVACGDGGLELVTVQPEGKRSMPAVDYLRGQGAGRGFVLGRGANV